MTQPIKPTLPYAIEEAARSALSVVVAVLALFASNLVVAQTSVTLQQDVTIYRAFYYDASNNLLHIENVRGVAGRYLTPLFSTPPAAPLTPPNEGPAVLIGANASYAVYYGTAGPNQPKFKPGDSNAMSKPVAFEKLSAADAFRPIECATKGEDVCLFPKMCHCAPVGGCCCY